MTTTVINNVPRDWLYRVRDLLYEVANETGPLGAEANAIGTFLPDIFATAQAVSDGETFMGEPAIHAELLVERKAMQRLFKACGCSGAVDNTQLVNMAANKLEAQPAADGPVISPLEMSIEAAEEEHGGLRAAAKALGIDPGYLSRLKNGEKVNPSDEVLSALGLVRVTYYRQKQEQPE